MLTTDLNVKSKVGEACRRECCLYVRYMATKSQHRINVLMRTLNRRSVSDVEKMLFSLWQDHNRLNILDSALK